MACWNIEGKGMEKNVGCAHAHWIVNCSCLEASAPNLRGSLSFTQALRMDESKVLWKYILTLLMCALPCVYVNLYWCMMVAYFTPKISLSCLDEWRGYVISDTCPQDRMGASMVTAENMAWQILLWLLWCSLVPFLMFVCGKQFSRQLNCLLEGHHREHSVYPTDVETRNGELKQAL